MSEVSLTSANVQPKISKNGKRLWSKAYKRLIVSEAMKPGTSVSQVSRRYDVNANLIFRWMKAAGVEPQGKQHLIPVGIVERPSVASPERGEGSSLPSVPRKLLEIELRNGVKITIDGDVRMPVLQSVLKLVRGLA